MISVELFFPGDSIWTDVSSLVKPETINSHSVLFNAKFKSVIDSFNFELKYEASINQKFYSSNGKILCKIEKDEVPEFTGYITTELDQTSYTYVTPLRIQAFDNSWLLDESITDSFEFPATIGASAFKIFDSTDQDNSIIHQILELAGYTLSTDIASSCPQITETVQHICGESGKGTYRAILDKLLSEFGFVLTFLKNGQFSIIQLCRDSITPEYTLNEDLGMITGLKISKGFWEHDGIKLKWVDLETVDNMLVYRFSLPLSLVDGVYQFTGKAVAAGDYYPADSDIEDIYQTFRSEWLDQPYISRDTRLENKDIAIISTSNHQVNFEAEEDFIIASQSFEPKRAKVSFRNNGSETAHIYTAEIKASVLYRNTIKEVIVPATATNPEEYTSEHLFTSEHANKNAIWRCRTKLFGMFKYNFQRRKTAGILPLGSVIRVLRDTPNIDTTVIVYDCKSSEHLPMVTYNAIAITAYATENVRTTAQTSVVIPVQELSEAASLLNQVVSGFGDSLNDNTLIPANVTILNTQSRYMAISFTIQKQQNLTGFSHYEISVSADDGTGASDDEWFEPRFDGVDWKYTTPQRTDKPWVDWPLEYFLHPEIKLPGSVDDPQGRTLHYRVRAVTKKNDKSDWTVSSAQTSAAASPIPDGSLSKNSVHANNMVTGILQALFAMIEELYVAFDGSGTPSAPINGDLSFYFNKVKLSLQEFTNENWSDSNAIRLGGRDSNGVFISGVACRQVVNPLAEEIGQEFLPEENFHVVDFESSYTDQNGITPSTSNALRDTTWSKFGDYSFTATSSNYGYLQYNDLLNLDGLISFGAWFNFTIPTGGTSNISIVHGLYSIDIGVEYLEIALNYSPSAEYFDFNITEQDTGVVQSVHVYLSKTATEVTGEHFIAFIIDTDTGDVTLQFDGVQETESINPIILTDSASSNLFTVFGYNSYTIGGISVSIAIDDLLFSTDLSADPDLFLQHYLHEQPWNTEASAKDLIFNVPSGGRYRFLGIDSDWHIVGDTGEPAFENGFGAYDTSNRGPVKFRKDALGNVWLSGAINNSGTNGQAAFSLPEGFRPVFNIVPATYDGRTLAIDADGDVRPTQSTIIYLGGISFTTE